MALPAGGHHDCRWRMKPEGMGMDDSRELEIQEAIDGVLARLRVQEMALLELLVTLPRHNPIALANGLRARVNEWALSAGPPPHPGR